MNELEIDPKAALKKPPGNVNAEITALDSLTRLLNDPELSATGDIPPPLKPAMPEIDPGATAETIAPLPRPAQIERVKFPMKIFTTGRMKTGKDFFLKKIGCAIHGFADPLYELQRLFFNSDDKDAPGARKFLQQVGQWGRGEVNEFYPLTAERAVFTTMVRTMGPTGLIPCKTRVNWENFGKSENLWVEALQNRINEQIAAQAAAQAAVDPSKTLRIGISNVRFDNEQAILRSVGFIHFHVMCSLKTWAKRLEKSNLNLKSAEITDTSEKLAATVEASITETVRKQPRGTKLRVIWNDPEALSPSSRFITLADIETAMSA